MLQASRQTLVDHLDGALIVSCQPVKGGPMDRAEIVVAFALAALAGGAKGLRVESEAYVRAVRAVTDAPIIGLIKRDLPDSPVKITPHKSDVVALIGAGADVIAIDATDRDRPVPVEDLLSVIAAADRVSMADCATMDDARHALSAGADVVASTLAGYTGGPEPDAPDYGLIEAMRQLTPNVFAEGRIRRPEDAARARRCGAHAVVVGSAITRTEHVTGWFASELATAGRARTL